MDLTNVADTLIVTAGVVTVILSKDGHLPWVKKPAPRSRASAAPSASGKQETPDP